MDSAVPYAVLLAYYLRITALRPLFYSDGPRDFSKGGNGIFVGSADGGYFGPIALFSSIIIYSISRGKYLIDLQLISFPDKWGFVCVLESGGVEWKGGGRCGGRRVNLMNVEVYYLSPVDSIFVLMMIRLNS